MLKYRIGEKGTFVDPEWIQYQTDPLVYVFVPSSWGNKRALVSLMQEGLSAMVMPGTPYRLLEGTPAAIAEEVNQTACLLLGPLQQKQGGPFFQAVVEYSGLARKSRALEMWGEIIKSKVTQ